MRTLIVSLMLAILAAACTTSTAPSTTIATSTSASVADGSRLVIPDQLATHEIKDVRVGERVLTLAIADSPSLREQGLMRVESLGDLDGMLFYWRHEAFGDGFWMKDTLIPLDVVFFLEDGTYAGRASMTPCPPDESDCPTYGPGEGVDYRLAIEANPGDLDWIDESTVIEYSD